MTEEEKGRLSVYEKELVERQEQLETKQNQFKEQIVQQNKNDVFAVLSGNDDELRKQIEFHYARLPEEAVTKEEVAKKAKEAYLLAQGGRISGGVPNQLSRVMGSYTPPQGGSTQSDLTEEQRALAKNLGISEEELKKLK